MSACYELGSIISRALSGAVTCEDEVHGFRYMDGRAIIGFVDGTENPNLRMSAKSMRLSATKIRDLPAAAMPLCRNTFTIWMPAEPEHRRSGKVIGRHKFNDVELTDEQKIPAPTMW